MIPVRAIDDGRAPPLAYLVAQNVDLFESGLVVTTTDLAFGDDVVLDVLARDVDGRPVLVLVEDGPGEPLFERAAAAVLEFKRAARALHLLNPERGFDVHETPRVFVVARRVAERTEALLALLRVPQMRIFECTAVDGATGYQLVITARSAAGTTLRPVRPADEGLHAFHAAAAHAPHGPSAGELRFHEPRQPPRPRAAERKKGADGARRAQRALSDELKARILRMSPDILEEQDGEVLTFRVGEHVLARVDKEQGDPRLVAGGEGAPEFRVVDVDSLVAGVDAVFERFFNLSSSRRRAAEPRARREAAPLLETEVEAGHGGQGAERLLG